MVRPVLEIDIGKPVIYLSAVVIAELYAGAFDNQSVKLLDKLYKAFYDTQKIVAPTSNDWQTMGKVVAKRGGKYGFENLFLSRIQNGVLIALSAKEKCIICFVWVNLLNGENSGGFCRRYLYFISCTIKTKPMGIKRLRMLSGLGIATAKGVLRNDENYSCNI